MVPSLDEVMEVHLWSESEFGVHVAPESVEVHMQGEPSTNSPTAASLVPLLDEVMDVQGILLSVPGTRSVHVAPESVEIQMCPR